MKQEHGYVLFADIKGFSKIADAEILRYMGKAWLKVSQILKPHRDSIVAYNTWGDALFLVFKQAKTVNAVLGIRDWFRQHKHLAIRIACHYGNFHEYQDPMLGRMNAFGATVNLAARIEPVTRANDIFVTPQFVDKLRHSTDKEKPKNLMFDSLGAVELAKRFGVTELLVLRNNDEQPHILDQLVNQDLSPSLPEVAPMSVAQEHELKELTALSPEALKQRQFTAADNGNATFTLEVAKLLQSTGCYKEAHILIEKLNVFTLFADDFEVQPFSNNYEFLKLRANNATRRGDFRTAHRLLYNLHKAEAITNTDTLTMLASCYKRRAFFTSNGEFRDHVEQEPLVRSRNLYMEAVRYDISDIYSVINAAYAYAFLGDDKHATNLARYCASLLDTANSDWYRGAAFAETFIIRGRYNHALDLLNKARETYNPSRLELIAVSDQLRLLGRCRAAEQNEINRLRAALNSD